MTEIRFCGKCEQEKPLNQFYKKDKVRWRGTCKQCSNDAARNWALNNPEKRREVVNKYARNNRSKACENSIKSQINNPEAYLCRAARTRSMKSGIPFDLTAADIFIPAVCPVFHTPFVRGTESAASLDRIDNDIGYTKGNVQVLSRRANAMKRDATPAQLKQFAKWILNVG